MKVNTAKTFNPFRLFPFSPFRPKLPSNKETSQPIILVVAGEASGDAHGARLVAAIKERLPEARFLWVGGEALAGQGVEILCQASELAVVGLSDVFGQIGRAHV